MDHNLEHDGVHVVVDCEILDDPLQPELVRGVTTHSRQCTSNSQLDCTSKKESRLSQMGDALKAWAKASKARIQTSNTRTEALLAKVERYKSGTSNKATSASTNDFSIKNDTIALQVIDLPNNDKYLKAIKKFTFLDQREIFINMLGERKMA